MLIVDLLHVVKSDTLNAELPLKGLLNLKVGHLRGLSKPLEYSQVSDILCLSHVQFRQDLLQGAQRLN